MEPLPFNPNYKQWRYDWENKPVITKKEHSEALAKLRSALLVNRVILKGKDIDIALRIDRIRETPEGILVEVSHV